jgi:Holliday junction resolvasome RuvABC endonuclease subunit
LVCVGIDPGKTAGVAILEPGKKVPEVCQWELSAGCDMLATETARRIQMARNLSRELSRIDQRVNGKQPIRVWYEMAHLDQRTAIATLQLQVGVLYAWQHFSRVPTKLVEHVTPLSIRKVCLGRKSGKKADLRNVAKAITGRHFRARDEQHMADAVCILTAGMGST